MKALVCLAAVLLGGCATVPAPTCSAPPSQQDSALAARGYALVGTVSSLLIAGKLDGPTAIALNAELQAAEADLRAGKTAEARTLIDGVKAKLQ